MNASDNSTGVCVEEHGLGGLVQYWHILVHCEGVGQVLFVPRCVRFAALSRFMCAVGAFLQWRDRLAPTTQPGQGSLRNLGLVLWIRCEHICAIFLLEYQ